MARLYVLDTMFHIFRSFYALPQTLVTSRGLPTNALLGVYNFLRSLWSRGDVACCVAAFESLAPNFREELLPAYKANRGATPEPLKQQIPLVREMLEQLGFPVVSVEGFEADDVLGTLAWRAARAGVEIVVVSNDKDLAQVLAFGDTVSILQHKGTGSKAAYLPVNAVDVPGIYGVEAALIPDYLALCGDNSDNIPGLKGVGPKTAAKLLNAAGGLLPLLDNPGQAGRRWAQPLAEEATRLRRNLELTTICHEVPLPFEGLPLEELALKPIASTARDFFADLEMKGALRDLDQYRGDLFTDPTFADLICFS